MKHVFEGDLKNDFEGMKQIQFPKALKASVYLSGSIPIQINGLIPF